MLNEVNRNLTESYPKWLNRILSEKPGMLLSSDALKLMADMELKCTKTFWLKTVIVFNIILRKKKGKKVIEVVVLECKIEIKIKWIFLR